MSRVYNFSAGPSMLPQAVLEKAASEMLDYQGSGQSVMEMSHRSKTYQAIIDEAEALLREVLNSPDNYKVLFLQGGGSTQFAMIPLNLKKKGKADYVITGQWAKKAAAEAKKFLDVNVVASSADTTFTYIPKLDPATFSKDADYFYICLNNTIYGTHYSPEQLPDTGDIPLVTDASSCILSEPMDVSKFGLIFAGAQKNMGPAGVTVVIIREDLIQDVPENVPTMLTYKIHADNGSMYNTPPCYSIYMVKLVLEWLKNDIGGVEKMHELNKAKAAKLYDFLDNSKLFKGTVEKDSRSLMNVPFVTGDADRDAAFVKYAAARGLVNLKGHRSVGGMRASIYNAMPVEGVQKLVDFMKQFETEN